MTEDATAGGWNGRVWRLAGPLILSNMSIPLLGAVDTAVVGRMPDPSYIGAVALGSLVFSYLYWGCGFLRMGTTGLTAQAVGAGDLDEARAVFLRAAIVGAAAALLFVSLQAVIGKSAFGLLGGSVEVERLANLYFRTRIWGAPAALANFAVIGWLFGVEKTRYTLAIQIVQNLLNMGLDLLFVMAFGWGIRGVAVATVISEYVGLALGIVFVLRAARGVGGTWRWDLVAHRERLLHLLRVNGDIFIRTLALITGFAYFTQQGARMGDVTLAANAILMHFQAIQAYGLDAFAHAAEILIGGAVGSGRRDAFRKAVRVSTTWAAGTALVCCLLYAVGGGALIRAMTTIETVRDAARALLPWAIVSPIISVWSFQLDGIFLGATRTREMRNGMLVALGVFLVAVHTLVPLLGNHGLWLALMVYMLARACVLAAFYPRIVRQIGG
ncbi:MAG: MATE family efflux transporter [Candidatus Poribacteria bacterium]